MRPSAASSRAKTCSLSISGRVLISVTGNPRMTRSSGSSAPARRRKAFSTLNTTPLSEERRRLTRRAELFRHDGPVHVLEHDADERRLFADGDYLIVVVRDRFANRAHA